MHLFFQSARRYHPSFYSLQSFDEVFKLKIAKMSTCIFPSIWKSSCNFETCRFRNHIRFIFEKKPEINSSSSGSQITEMFYITTLQINFIKKYYFIFYAMWRRCIIIYFLLITKFFIRRILNYYFSCFSSRF